MYFICTGIMLILDKLMTIVVAIGDPQSHCKFYYILFTILFFIRFFKFVITNYLILNLRIFYFQEIPYSNIGNKKRNIRLHIWSYEFGHASFEV